jgi:hypothetical protein
MNDLSPAARAILETSRNAEVLTGADRDRIKRGVLLRLATLGAATATTGTAVGVSLASKITLVAVAATVLGGGAVSFWVLRGRTATPSGVAPDSSARRASAAAVPPPAVAPPEGVATAPSQPTEPGRYEGVKKTSKRPIVPSASASGSVSAAAVAPLDPELRVLREAREDLRAGLPENAYRRLVDYERSHGKGGLAQERQALSAIALCQWRPGPEAQARAAAFLRDAPESPLADRVRSACDNGAAP